MTVPPQSLAVLLDIMARLRDRERGCPWDLAQTFATLAPYTLEEAYEVVDAIDSGEPERLQDELGDLLFQVVFHARLAEERGWFDFADVARTIGDKLVRRHPHVFSAGHAAVDRAALSGQWEEHKAQERSAAALDRGGDGASALAGVALALPALARAAKLGKRAGRVGFDWMAASEVREKVMEELGELDAALRDHQAGESGEGDSVAAAAVVEELGDLLFAVANWGRHMRVDPEAALRAANAKFERRFAHMEHEARERGLTLTALSPAEWDVLWREAKSA